MKHALSYSIRVRAKLNYAVARSRYESRYSLEGCIPHGNLGWMSCRGAGSENPKKIKNILRTVSLWNLEHELPACDKISLFSCSVYSYIATKDPANINKKQGPCSVPALGPCGAGVYHFVNAVGSNVNWRVLPACVCLPPSGVMTRVSLADAVTSISCCFSRVGVARQNITLQQQCRSSV